MKRKYGHKKKGEHYEPTSMVGQIKAIPQLFNCASNQNQRGACQYSLFKDFRGEGEFESILQDIWQEEMDKDPHFGKKPFQARIDPQAYKKVQEAIRSGEFDLNNVHDLLLLNIFIQGHKFWLRGCNKQHGRKWSEYTFSSVNNVDKASLDLTKDKTYKPWVIDHLVKVRDRLFIMETMEGDPLYFPQTQPL